jgi:hypothetical protein
LTVRPDLWDQGVGKRLMEPIMGCFESWGNSHLGLFTFSHSPKHLELYRRYGFWPRFLTAVMRKQVAPSGSMPIHVTYADMSAADQAEYIRLSHLDRLCVRGSGPGTRDFGGSCPGTRRHRAAPGRVGARRLGRVPSRSGIGGRDGCLLR